MRPVALAFGVTILAVGASACGGEERSSGSETGRSYGTEVWYEASPGEDPGEIVVRFDGPARSDDDACEPDRQVVVAEEGDEVRLTVRRYSPSPVVICPVETQTATVTLDTPLGGRTLVNPGTGWRFRADGDRFVLDPASTPCAREDCSAPAAAEASCDPLEFAIVVDEQLRPGRAADADVRCDGSFLTLVRDGKRAWFVNREASWRLVTNGETTCEAVHRTSRIRFPAAFCT